MHGPLSENTAPRKRDGVRKSVVWTSWDRMASLSRSFQNLIHLVPARHLASQRRHRAIIDGRKITFIHHCVKVVRSREGSRRVLQE